QLCRLNLARDAPLEFRPKYRAGAVSHDGIFTSLDSQRMRHAGRNDNAHVACAAMIIAIDKKAHDSREQTSAHIPQDHLQAALQKKHYVPLLGLIIMSCRCVLAEFPPTIWLGLRQPGYKADAREIL